MYISQVMEPLFYEGRERNPQGEPLGLLRADLKRAGYVSYAGKETIRRHGPHNELQLILEGQTEVHINGKSLGLLRGPGVQVFSLGQEVDITNHPGLRKVFFHCDLPLGHTDLMLGEAPIQKAMSLGLTPWWEKMTLAMANPNPLALQALLYEALGLVWAEFAEISARRGGTLGRFERYFRYVNETPVRDFSLARAAEGFGLHPTHFSNTFKNAFGMSAKQFFLNEKIRRVKDRLTKDGERLAVLADDLGFCDAFHFSRTFKKHTGLSPREFRERYGEGPQKARDSRGT